MSSKRRETQFLFSQCDFQKGLELPASGRITLPIHREVSSLARIGVNWIGGEPVRRPQRSSRGLTSLSVKTTWRFGTLDAARYGSFVDGLMAICSVSIVSICWHR